MINNIYLDSAFNFLLLENIEDENNLITLKFHTSSASNQVLTITAADGTSVSDDLGSDYDIEYQIAEELWSNNGATTIVLSNSQGTQGRVLLIFEKIPTVSAALNYAADESTQGNTILKMLWEDREQEESGGGSGSGGATGTDFVEIIRNIGFRLLDEPTSVNVEYNEISEQVEIKWEDPADIATNEPAPAEWAGTVVVRKEGGAPLHRWDGTEITDSTTRDQYKTNALIDANIDVYKTYYYGIFPYDTKGDYRYTKSVLVSIASPETPEVELTALSVDRVSITATYSVPSGYTWDYITLVYKKNSAPASKTDGTTVSLSDSGSSVTVSSLDEGSTYYFKIFASVQGMGESASDTLNAKTQHTTTAYLHDLQLNDVIGQNCAYGSSLNQFPTTNAGQDFCIDEYSQNPYSMPTFSNGTYTFAQRSTGIRIYGFAIPNSKTKKVSGKVKISNYSGQGCIIYVGSINKSTNPDVSLGSYTVSIVGTQYASTSNYQINNNEWSEVGLSYDFDDNTQATHIWLGAWTGLNELKDMLVTYWTD